MRKIRSNIYYISISDTTERIFKREYGNHFKIIRINNPIDSPLSVVFEENARDSYLFMARLSSEKGLDLFCEAITQLGLKGIVLGTGELYETYKEKYPNIEFAGWVRGEQKIPYLKQSKCLIFPSKWYEGAPLTTIEIMTYGIPCITSNECAASELIKEGINGFIFQTGKLESLKNAILKMEKSNLLSRRKQIQSSIDMNLFGEERHIEKLISAYETANSASRKT